MTHQQDERGDPLTRTHDAARKDFAARESRQGGLGRPVLRVLGASLALALLVWGAVEIWGQRVGPTVDTEQTSSTSNGTQIPGAGTVEDIAPGGETDRDPAQQSGTGGDSQKATPDGTGN